MAAPAKKGSWISANLGIAIVCLAFFTGMIGMSYAAVPLYKMFCQVTGYGGTTRRVEQYSDTILDKTMDVRFDTNTAGVPWDFRPVQRRVSLKIGETVQVEFTAKNISSRTTRGRATFNVTPMAAGAYFNKVECFCFTRQTLQPGETVRMPVLFYVDPSLADHSDLDYVDTITLSYTFNLVAGAEEEPTTVGGDG